MHLEEDARHQSRHFSHDLRIGRTVGTICIEEGASAGGTDGKENGVAIVVARESLELDDMGIVVGAEQHCGRRLSGTVGGREGRTGSRECV